MPYSPQSGPAEYDRLKALVLTIGHAMGEFDSNDVAYNASMRRSTLPRALTNAGDVGPVLRDLVDLGIIECLSEEPPQRYRLV